MCLLKTDNVNLIVGSIIVVLVKLTFFLIRLRTQFIVLVNSSAITQLLNSLLWDGHNIFNIFFLKPRVREIMVMGKFQQTRDSLCICFQFRRKTMNKKFVCAVLLMLVAVAINLAHNLQEVLR